VALDRPKALLVYKVLLLGREDAPLVVHRARAEQDLRLSVGCVRDETIVNRHISSLVGV